MKKILFFIIISILTFAASGCKYNEETPLATTEDLEEEFISYNVEKILLSKGYQAIEPNIEILESNNNLKLLASLGLIESSGVEIDKITKVGKDVNIYIDRLLDRGKIQLSIPQIVIEINGLAAEKLEDLNFNIINKNYETIPLKFSKSQILGKIYSQFKIAPSTTPEVELTKSKDNIFWNISFQNIFDKESPKYPLINFAVKVDARTGDILDSDKDIISTFIDNGYLLDYIPNSYLLYKRQHIEGNNNEYENLWSYNIQTGERIKLYTSKDKIYSALFSPNNEYVSLIEIGGKKSDIYLIKNSDRTPYKITPTNYLQPKLIKWKDDNTLYFVNVSENKSTLLSYDIKENNSKVISGLNMVVEDFNLLDDKFVFAEADEDSLNKNIYLAESDMKLKKIGMGFKPTLFNDDNIIYLKHIDEEGKTLLNVYNINTKMNYNDLDHDIANYFKLDDKSIIFSEKNTCNSEYTLIKYNMIEKLITPIAKINNDKVFYDSNQEKGFLNLILPFEDSERSVIYSIDLKKLNVIND